MFDKQNLAQIRNYARKILVDVVGTDGQNPNRDTGVLAFCVLLLCDELTSSQSEESTSLSGQELDAAYNQEDAIARMKQEAEKNLFAKQLKLE